jgi:hypothetical protein
MSEVKKITVTRGMRDLKLLKDRIDKKIARAKFVGIHQNKKDEVLQVCVTKSQFVKDAEANYESIIDMIEQRKQIKSKIMLSNAVTMVKIGGQEYTITEALARKNSIEFEQNFLAQMRHQLSIMRDAIERQKPKLEESVQKMIEENLGKDAKPTKEDYNTIADPFLKANELNLLDPCDISKKVEELDDDIDTFLAEVDLVLSESNAKTEIEITV